MNYAIQDMIYAWGPKDAKLRGVLLAIAAHADKNGVAYPGLLTLADKCCCDVRTVQRRLESLERAGWMSIQRRARSIETARGWEKRGNVYQIHLNRLRGDAQGRRVGTSSAVGSDARQGDVQDAEKHRSRPEENAVRDDKTQLARRQNESFEMTKQAVRDDKIDAPLMNYQELPENYQSEEIPPKAPLAARAPVDSAASPDAGVQLCLNVGKAKATASAKATATTSSLRKPAVSMECGGKGSVSSGARVLEFRRREVRPADGMERALWDEAEHVLRCCGVADPTRRMRQTVIASLRLAVDVGDRTVADVGLAMTQSWERYLDHSWALFRNVGVRQFVRDGYWLDERRWDWDRVAMKRRSQF